MYFDVSLPRLIRLLAPVAFLSTTYLYFYPFWLACAFPTTDRNTLTSLRRTFEQHFLPNSEESFSADCSVAPFRLLVLADPPLEGDSSLPKPEDALRHKIGLHLERVWEAIGTNVTSTVASVVKEVVTEDVPRSLSAYRKRLDLLGNDYYLAHIFRTLHWWSKPTHVTVLGDLVGSQWVDDDEFDWRAWRYWNRVFAGAHKIEDEIMDLHERDKVPLLRMDDPEWNKRIINIVGNHDIGYAGDISKGRMERFERLFGRANWDVRFEHPKNDSSSILPTLHLVVFNSMLLDTPAMEEELQDQNYQYLNSIIQQRTAPVEDLSSFILLLTHVPLYKPEGVCVDAPFFDFFSEEEDCGGQCRPGGLKEQNHLSDFASRSGTLQSLFGMSGSEHAPREGRGRPGVILNGHDHEGCDSWHYIPTNETMELDLLSGESKTNWQATHWKQAEPSTAHTGIREITLRSMMGEFGGNAGLFSAWYNFDQEKWEYDIKMCKLGIQHIWWAVHTLDIIFIALLFVQISGSAWSRLVGQRTTDHSAATKSTKID